MAQNTTIPLAPGVWTLLTNAAVTGLTFQNVGGYDVLILGTAGAFEPVSTDGAISYGPGEGEMAAALADLFPGVAGADRLYAYAPAGGRVMISHA